MYYHIMIQTEETGEIYEIDKLDLGIIVEDIVKPYVNNQDFNFDGYFIEPSKVKRIRISETEKDSNYYYEIELAKMNRDSFFFPISKEDLVTQSDKYSRDLTRDILKQVKQQSINDNHDTNSANPVKKTTDGKTIFVAYSYREEDDEFVAGFKDLLESMGYSVLDGKADRFGSISEAILEKISISDIISIIMNKRDRKENGKYTTSAWLLEEKGAALALNKQVVMFVEEDIDEGDIGGLQGDSQRFHFTRNNFLSKAMNFIKILKKQ